MYYNNEYKENFVCYTKYFLNDFRNSNLKIAEYANQEFQSVNGLSDEEKSKTVLNTYQNITEKKNPLRNQIKLMKIELKELLNPILSV